MRRYTLAPIAVGLLCTAFAAQAGSVSCAASACTDSFATARYAPAHCPAPPEVPHLKSGDKATYDHSVALAKAYSDAASARMNCIIDEANTDATQLQAAIKAGVKQQQDEAQAKLSALQTALNNLPRH
ncbi:MAG TPA: hypothetical protein VGV37_14995 [Aliidongia sp.]|uniref:hypothetical protein n=1 Tax=Aliidongia sp. TaxID=1914230 RepID=UPI002DDD280D|nr:hypothetical protein [Aliidongia sp.]HEV2675850.1 hypothetical protein [Aliidongia sp.]